ncbi:magnesium transporter [Halalkalicoccus jeotgali]|uniref:Transport system 48 (Substrate zinc), subunit 2 n=1 Tax=Halalkalicoccus jeotgali (strain DSM 18796 / CECT 7217 / JCM 14584 / KCTC 4019 / B3) TaxID=795797 RepID=D8J8A8_HALJB|nr:magnesium transporter [Halalkalicoccus jeotgali]ADJ16154.1 transport system 48 (substrate zinc), subunit 2 [Halalkalicoccus jeotgali B3]ELY37583.1 transport system subunit 2 [Halalkalicoccus jeotgali B3]
MSADDRIDTWSVRSIVVTMMPLLIALSVLEMGSGFVLETLEETYLDNPVLLVLVPVMIGMGGNLGSVLSSRLTTRFHLGTLSFSPRDEALRTNVLAILALAVTIFSALGVAAYVLGRLLGEPMGLGTLLTITLLSGMTLAVLAVVLSIAAAYASYRFGLDPDDVTIPVVTNVCDILGVVVLSVVAIVVLEGGTSLAALVGLG